ncbi:hypothetical protein KA478_00290 [Patescibacteria group bacterium]|nr:hypothetical protein [Patescibacteria group bacterium]
MVRARLTGDEICRAYEEQRDAYIEAGKPKDARWKPEFNKLVACDSQECVDILTSCGGKYAFVAQDPAAQKAMQEFVK